MEMVCQERIATVRVGHRCSEEVAGLQLVRLNDREYAVRICLVDDDKDRNVLVTENRDEAVEAFKIWTGILVALAAAGSAAGILARFISMPFRFVCNLYLKFKTRGGTL